MIVWSGRGFLIALISVGILYSCTSFIENSDYAFMLTAFLTGIFSWFFGKKWNKKNEQVVVIEKTKERIILKNNHTFFWIPMQYWGIIFFVFGISILFQNSIILGIMFSIILLIFVYIEFLKPLEFNFERKKYFVEEKTKIEKPEQIEKVEVKDFEPSDHNKFMPK